MSKVGNLVFVNSVDVGLVGLLPLLRSAHPFKFFDDAFGNAREAAGVLGEVVFAFDGCFVIQVNCTFSCCFKLKLFGSDSIPSPIIHFDTRIPTLAALLLIQGA